MNEQNPTRVFVRRSGLGFSQIELLTVIAVIGILAAILIPVVSKIRDNTMTVTCASNLRQVHAGMMGYAYDNSGYLPDVNLRDNERQRWMQWWQALNVYMGSNVESGFPAYKVQQCPAVNELADDLLTRNDRTELPNYGMNYYLGRSGGNNNTTPSGTQIKVAMISDPARIILAGDSSISVAGRSASAGLTPTTVALQGDKHPNGSNLLWVDGHVSQWKDVSRLGEAPYAPGSTEDVWKP